MKNSTEKLPGSAADPLWYKDAILYQVHVRSFYDSTGDGVGDFIGLTEKLDYIQSLGVTALWLLPFYPSPLRDDGYDIAHYEGVHPAYGTLRDFKTFLRAAHARGLQVITELVVNHTSDQHPWFQAARQAPPGSSKRDYYVWSETKIKYAGARVIFNDSETSNWTWDERAKAYYWHRFFHHQPDLNYDNPRVRRAVLKTMRFWFDMGVDGVRLDAVPYLIEREGTNCENLPETHHVLKEIRRALDQYYSCRMLLAEANQWPPDVRPYFGDGDECHMAFNFPLMPRIFMALRQEDRHPITEILRQTPAIPEACQWAIFLRNHDELTLEMVTDEERDYMYQHYAADPQMRLNMGIRRRLAPLMENSRPRIELLNSLLLSLPGAPILYYGDELGMGDNVYLGDRNGVRTPMQWTGDRNAGFSRADPARLFAPVIMDAVYGYQAINVEAQERTPFSLLNWMKRMVALRRQHRTFSRGTLEFLYPRNRKVFAYLRRYEGEVILCIANLSRHSQPAELNLAKFDGLAPIEMLGRTEFPRIGELPYFLTLGPYAFYWFLLERTPSSITARVAPHPEERVEEVPAFFAGPMWETILDGNVRTLIEREALVPFLQRQRWFGGKARQIAEVRIVDWGLARRGPQPVFFTLVDVDYGGQPTERYFVPLVVREDLTVSDLHTSPSVVARVTGARKGVIVDATLDESFALSLVDSIARAAEFPTRHATIRAFPTKAFSLDTLPQRVTRSRAEQSNTSLIYGGRFILKLFRRLEPGTNPDMEIGRYLTERAEFTRVPATVGGFELAGAGEPTTLAQLQTLVLSQANGWDHAVDELKRYYERAEARAGEQPAALADTRGPLDLLDANPPSIVLDTVGGYMEVASLLGRRTAELHLALAREVSDPAFAAESFDARVLGEMAARLADQAGQTLTLLEVNLEKAVRAGAAEAARTVLARADRLVTFFKRLPERRFASLWIRVHGDYHLGQVLWAEGDWIILDFEGEPARSLAERRAKQSALKDVAGMLRSFSYAAYASVVAHTVDRPDLLQVLEPWARLWQTWTSVEFLRAYLEAASGAPFIPAARSQLGILLRAFLLDKALYELRYELNNRPDWVRIPLWGLVPLIPTPEENE